jgi:hypothetical protein
VFADFRAVAINHHISLWNCLLGLPE